MESDPSFEYTNLNIHNRVTKENCKKYSQFRDGGVFENLGIALTAIQGRLKVPILPLWCAKSGGACLLRKQAFLSTLSKSGCAEEPLITLDLQFWVGGRGIKKFFELSIFGLFLWTLSKQDVRRTKVDW